MASLYVDGAHIVSVDGLRMRNSEEQVFDSMVFHTFFGGSGSDWAAIKDEVRLSIYRQFLLMLLESLAQFLWG